MVEAEQWRKDAGVRELEARWEGEGKESCVCVRKGLKW